VTEETGHAYHFLALGLLLIRVRRSLANDASSWNLARAVEGVRGLLERNAHLASVQHDLEAIFAEVGGEQEGAAIRWDRTLSIGIPAVDEQHQELFRQVSSLVETMEQGKGRAVTGRLVGFLSEYVVEHFGAEQDLMKQHDYPELAAHRAQHDEFMSTLRLISEELERTGPTIVLAIKLNRLVCPWLRLHIGTADRALGRFMAEVRATPLLSGRGG
jgi:hemerythrin-like metal-binding protein